MWKLSDTERRESRGWKVKCRCECGKEQWVAYADLRAGSAGCRPCSGRARMQRELAERPDEVRSRLRAASAKAAEAVRKPEEFTRIRYIMQGAKGRCESPTDSAYPGYGGRGIQFKFASGAAAAQWVLDNLGPRPSPKHSIDRVDNEGHYEPGNLRWATAKEQNRNKRDYCGPQYGHRLQKLLALRPDYTYEGLRKYINLGWTDTQILALEKPRGGRPRKC